MLGTGTGLHTKPGNIQGKSPLPLFGLHDPETELGNSGFVIQMAETVPVQKQCIGITLLIFTDLQAARACAGFPGDLFAGITAAVGA